MFKYKVKCPHCGKELTYYLLHRDWDDLHCSHCGKAYVVNLRILVIIVMLILFLLIQNIYTVFLAAYVPIIPVLIFGVIFVLFVSNLLIQLVSWKFGSGLFFETAPKVAKQSKKNK